MASWPAYLITVMKQVELLAKRVQHLETLEASIGKNHDHDGGDGLQIPTNGIQDLAITEAKLAAAVSGQLVTNGDTHDHAGGDGAVITTSAIQDSAVSEAKLAAAVIAQLVTNGDSHNHAGGDGGTIGESGVSFSGKLVTNGDTHNHFGGDGGTILEESLESQVTGKLVTNGNSHNHSGGDGATLPQSALDASTQGKLVTNGDSHNHDGGDGASIGTGAIANNAVDDTKVGNRVAQFYRRKGGSSTNWKTAGTTTYTPGAVRCQFGSYNHDGSPVDQAISFPTSFGNVPLVLISFSTYDGGNWFAVWSVTSSSFTVRNQLGFSVEVHWIAIGPE